MSNYASFKCSVCGGRDRWSTDNLPESELLVCTYCINPKSLRNVILAGAVKQKRREVKDEL